MTLRNDDISRGRLRRTAPLVGLAARTTGGAMAAGLRSRLTGEQDVWFHQQAAERYAELLGRSKGVLMKAGQLLSFAAAGPIISAELQPVYQTALSRLREDAPPMSPELARGVLEHELGCAAEGAFAELDWEPLAAASIGQVHAARLHDGRRVAVKIQYPGVAEAISADLKNVELLATFMSLIGGLSPRWLGCDFRGVAYELGVRIGEELDYRREAVTQAEFAKRYRGHPFIHVPDVVAELCTGRVLTQELVQGLSWEAARKADQKLRNSWAEAIMRFDFGSKMRFGLYHADPHPGNYVVHEDGGVSFLDFGCVKRFDKAHVDVLRTVLNACITEDVLGMWRACIEAGFWRASAPVTPEEVFAFWHDPWEMFWREAPFAVTPDRVAKWIECKYSPKGPSANALRHFIPSPEYTIMGRIEIGVASLLAHLRPVNCWKAIAAEYFVGTAPTTKLGELDRAFFERRGVGASSRR